MTIQEVAALIDGTVQTKTVDTSREVTCGYTCDLLSWVMAKGREGMAWATVQAHMNVVAVAVLADMSCVIAAEGVQFGADVIEKAEEEGVALITEDRKVTGLNLSGSVNDNIAMVAIKKLLSHGLYNKNKARAASMEYIKKLNIKPPSGDQITGNLSGGNQQKIVIAKWLLNDPDIIILDEPTRGIDVGAKRDIYLLLGKLVQQGKAVIMISSEIPELMGVCDRIMVMCEGNLSGEVQRGEFSQERIMTLASAIEV